MSATAPAQEPLYTSNPRFRIPFQFDSQEMARIGAREVQLHVSTDRGGSWRLAESVSPADQKFAFAAVTNGEYWFSVRTIDAQRRPHPAGDLQPGLIVVVDDIPPVLTLSGYESAPGQVELSWQATDDYVDASSLRLERLDAATGAWQPINLTPAAEGVTRFADASGGEILIRGSVSDLAGNSTSSNAAVRTTAPSFPSQMQREQPDFREPVADQDLELPPSLTQSPRAPAAALPMILPNMGHAPVPAVPVIEASTTRNREAAAPAVSPTPSVTQPEPTFKQAHAEPSPPPAVQDGVRRVNSRNLRLGYSLQDVGPSGIGSVDLYVTEDDGGKWFHYGSDSDLQSPIDVALPRDGRYGFAVRVRNGAGLASNPPQPGEAPEMMVVIDQTAPTVAILALEQRSTGGDCQARIQWKAHDERLAEQPIAIKQSRSANGPWEPVSGWMQNSGEWSWSLQGAEAGTLFVRLEVRDAAGNVCTLDADRPLTIDLSRPTARILEVESVRGSSLTR
jgi:hypothetical protein